MYVKLATFQSTAAFVFCGIVHGEIFELRGTKIPTNWTLQELHAYYIYDTADAPTGEQEAYLEFENIRYQSSSPVGMSEYVGIQLTLVRYQDLMQIPIDFCCTVVDVEQGRCPVADQIVYRHSVGGPSGELDVHKVTVKPWSQTGRRGVSQHETLKSTGAYVLVVSNCGRVDFDHASLSGQVKVRNPYGFLSGVDYFKMPLYMALTAIYSILALIWLLFCLIYREELFRIQRCIGYVILLAFAEAGLWFMNYHTMNEVGSRVWAIFLAATWLSVSKSIFSYMLVLVGAMGWGITKPYLQSCTVCKIFCMSSLFIVLDCIRRVVLSFRHSSPTFPDTFLFGCLLSVSLLNAVIFIWVFTALGNLMETLKAKNELEKFAVFQQLWWVLVLVLVVGTLSQLHEFFSLSRGLEERWRMQWFFADGMSHLLFIVVLLAMMVLWRPSMNNKRYAFSQQVDDKEMNDVASALPDQADLEVDVEVTVQDMPALRPSLTLRPGEEKLGEEVPSSMRRSSLRSDDDFALFEVSSAYDVNVVQRSSGVYRPGGQLREDTDEPTAPEVSSPKKKKKRWKKRELSKSEVRSSLRRSSVMEQFGEQTDEEAPLFLRRSSSVFSADEQTANWAQAASTLRSRTNGTAVASREQTEETLTGSEVSSYLRRSSFYTDDDQESSFYRRDSAYGDEVAGRSSMFGSGRGSMFGQGRGSMFGHGRSSMFGQGDAPAEQTEEERTASEAQSLNGRSSMFGQGRSSMFGQGRSSMLGQEDAFAEPAPVERTSSEAQSSSRRSSVQTGSEAQSSSRRSSVQTGSEGHSSSRRSSAFDLLPELTEEDQTAAEVMPAMRTSGVYRPGGALLEEPQEELEAEVMPQLRTSGVYRPGVALLEGPQEELGAEVMPQLRTSGVYRPGVALLEQPQEEFDVEVPPPFMPSADYDPGDEFQEPVEEDPTIHGHMLRNSAVYRPADAPMEPLEEQFTAEVPFSADVATHGLQHEDEVESEHSIQPRSLQRLSRLSEVKSTRIGKTQL